MTIEGDTIAAIAMTIEGDTRGDRDGIGSRRDDDRGRHHRGDRDGIGSRRMTIEGDTIAAIATASGAGG